VTTLGRAWWLRRRFANWREILAAERAGRPLTRVELRGGPTLEAHARSELLYIVGEVFLDQSYLGAGGTIGRGDVVVDIGANVGALTVFAGVRGARVLAVEPSPENLVALRRNIARNGLGDVAVAEVAVADADGTRTLYFDALAGADRIFETGLGGVDPRGSVEVETVTLETLLARHGVDRVDFLKIDCEGAEGLILPSVSPGTFERVRRIALEFHDGLSPLSRHELRALLDGAGFVTSLRVDGDLPFGMIHAHRA
jgi:FkbM family methyltransferase